MPGRGIPNRSAAEGGYAAKARHGSRGANYDSAARQTDNEGAVPRNGSLHKVRSSTVRAGARIYAVAMDVEEELEFSPTCAMCLMQQLEPVEVGRHVVWECPSCGLVRIA